MQPVRINKFLASAGVCSRRKAEILVLGGRVRVNGVQVRDLSFRVDPENDAVALDGAPVRKEAESVYVILNKPVGVITSARDELGRKTVLDFVGVRERLHYAGRLDSDTSGLVLLTNDGVVSQKLTHPRNKIPKTYSALVRGVPSRKAVEMFSSGMKVEDYYTSPAKMRIEEIFSDSSMLEITVTEGRKRQVRKMCGQIGHPVLSLKRTALGELKLGRLKEGSWRRLRPPETGYLKGL